MTDRPITHAPGCWGWGPKHYECALQEIKLMTAEWERVFAAKAEAEARAEQLAEALRYTVKQVPELATVPGIAAALEQEDV
jgi:hypothetical protein